MDLRKEVRLLFFGFCLLSGGCGGTAQLGGGSPNVTLSANSLAFGDVDEDTVSPPLTVMLTNSGTATLSIATIAVSANFVQTNNCGSTLAAGANCTIKVTVMPVSLGNMSGSLTVTDNAATSPQTVALSTSGVSQSGGSLEITSGAPPGGTVDMNYGPTVTQYSSCVWSPVYGWHWSCVPCTPSVSCPTKPCGKYNSDPFKPCVETEQVFGGFTFTAAGGVGPYVWSASGLPPGLSVDPSSGEITGTPTSTGSYNVSVTVSDSESPPAQTSANYPIEVGQ